MGLIDELIAYEEENKNHIFEVPQTVSWERIIMRQPDILDDIRDVIGREAAFFEKAQ